MGPHRFEELWFKYPASKRLASRCCRLPENGVYSCPVDHDSLATAVVLPLGRSSRIAEYYFAFYGPTELAAAISDVFPVYGV